MSDRYAPLAAFLAGLAPETTSVTLTLADLEVILGGPRGRAAATWLWWYNGRGRFQSPAWRGLGWEVTQAVVRAATPTLTFTRVAANGEAPPG